eukprot:2398973-Rhodomonas_salina.1
MAASVQCGAEVAYSSLPKLACDDLDVLFLDIGFAASAVGLVEADLQKQAMKEHNRQHQVTPHAPPPACLEPTSKRTLRLGNHRCIVL